MTSLSELYHHMSAVLEAIDEAGGEVTTDILPILYESEKLLSEKVDNYVYFLEHIQCQIEQKKKLIEKFRQEIKMLETLDEKLRQNAIYLMSLHKIEQLEGRERKMKLKNAGGVESMHKPDDFERYTVVVNEIYLKSIPEKCLEKKEFYVLKRDEFRDCVKENKIPCCFLLPRRKYIKLS